MRRLLICAIALTASAAPLITNHADAAGLSLRKPGKIDPTTMVVSGGLPFPLGLTCGLADAECINDGGYGHISISFPTPVDRGNYVDYFTATCTPRYAVALLSLDYPTAPITKTFGPLTANYADTPALRTQGYSKNGSTITLMMPKYEDPATSGLGAQYPPLSCQITSINNPLLHPGVYPGGGGYTVASKPPKLTSSPASDCRLIGDAANNNSVPVFAPSFMRPPNDPTFPNPSTLAGTRLHLSARIKAAGLEFQFCSTDASYRAKFVTDQQTIVSAQTTAKRGRATIANGVEIAPAPRTAAVKKLGLTIPFVTPIPLAISGSQIIYRFDPSKLQVVGGNAGCVMKPAKFAGEVNACAVDNVAGTFVLNSNAVALVKVGKPITSAQSTINFTYVNNALHPETTSAITLDVARLQITIGNVTVTVEFAPAGIHFGVADPNIGAPAITLTGLI